jgi:hypothetical protein
MLDTHGGAGGCQGCSGNVLFAVVGRVMRSTILDGTDGVCPADLRNAEEGGQTRSESHLPRIEEEKVLDDGGVIGTGAAQFLWQCPNG